MVDLHRQYLGIRDEVDRAIGDVIAETAFIKGPAVGLFEEELARRLEVRHCIACGNGTDALLLSLLAVGLQRGDEVIVPAFAFAAVAETVLLLGGVPVFADVDPRTFNIDPASVARLVSERTRVVIPVHLFGQPCDMAALTAVAKEHGLKVIEDNAQSLGAVCRMSDGARRYAGTIGEIGCTSFFPSKVLGCYGDGGAVFTDDLPLHTPLTLQETPALLLNRPSACIAAWRRTLFTDTGIRFRARGWGEDLCMTRKMLTAAQSVVILPDVLYLYRQHEGSVTKRALDANAEIMDAIDDVLTWYQARGLFEQYENELGKLCVDNVLYDASVRILKAQSAHPLLPQLLDFTAAHFPDYRHNPYLKGYPARKKLVLSLLGKKQYRAVHLLFAAAGH